MCASFSNITIDSLIAKGYKKLDNNLQRANCQYTELEKVLPKTNTRVVYAFNNVQKCARKEVFIGDKNTVRTTRCLEKITHRLESVRPYICLLRVKDSKRLENNAMFSSTAEVMKQRMKELCRLSMTEKTPQKLIRIIQNLWKI